MSAAQRKKDDDATEEVPLEEEAPALDEGPLVKEDGEFDIT